MTPFQKTRKKFLDQFCPNPALMLSAIERSQLWTQLDRLSGQFLCIRGDVIEECWLIIEGLVEVQSEGRTIALRGPGEIIGEQAFLYLLTRKTKEPLYRKVDVVVRGNSASLIRVDAAFQDEQHLDAEQRKIWTLTLAAVVNKKLEQAVQDRSRLIKQIEDKDRLLERFAEGEAIGLVKTALSEGSSPIQRREVIVWFSDIANFSKWSADKSATETARIARQLAEVQIELVRSAHGQIDKLTGDGLMAIWFIDTPERLATLPRKAIECAKAVVSRVQRVLQDERLTGQMDLRIGMHCGPAAFGDFGAKERIAVTVLGNAVNTAARYEQAHSNNPALGRIRVSPELRAVIDACFSGEKIQFIGPVEVKVKHGIPLTVFWL